MPKFTVQQDLDHLANLISRHQDGMAIDALLEVPESQMSRRTPQRRLTMLAQQGRLQRFGESRSARYRVTLSDLGTSIRAEVSVVPSPPSEYYVPTSAEGEAIKIFVRQPRQMREPVGYKLALLEQYQPNQTFYLPQSLRDQLHMLGRSPATRALREPSLATFLTVS
jgi:hypothetical protein